MAYVKFFNRMVFNLMILSTFCKTWKLNRRLFTRFNTNQSNKDSSMSIINDNSNFHPVNKSLTNYLEIPTHDTLSRMSDGLPLYKTYKPVDKPKRFQRIRNTIKSIKNWITGKKTKSYTKTTPRKVTNYPVKNGLFDNIKRTFRRRLLNFLDKYPNGWASSVTEDDAKAYISMPKYRKIKVKESMKPIGFIRGIVKGMREKIPNPFNNNKDANIIDSKNLLIPLSDSEMRVFASRRVAVKPNNEKIILKELPISNDLANLASNISFSETIPHFVWASITKLGKLFQRNENQTMKSMTKDNISESDDWVTALGKTLQKGVEIVPKMDTDRWKKVEGTVDSIRANYDVNYKAFMNNNESSYGDIAAEVAITIAESAWSLFSSAAISITSSIIDGSTTLRDKLFTSTENSTNIVSVTASISETITVPKPIDFSDYPLNTESVVSAVMSNEKIEVLNERSLKDDVISVANVALGVTFPLSKAVISYFTKSPSNEQAKAANSSDKEKKELSVKLLPQPKDIDMISSKLQNNIDKRSNYVEIVKDAPKPQEDNSFLSYINPLNIGSKIISYLPSMYSKDTIDVNNTDIEIEIETNSLDSDLILSYSPDSMKLKKVPFPLITEDKNILTNKSNISDKLQVQNIPKLPTVTPKITNVSIDANFNVKMGKSQEFKSKPMFLDKEKVPIASKADFSFINSRRIYVAISAALAITNEFDAIEYLREIGLKPLITAILSPMNDLPDVRIDAIKGICRLMRQDKSIAVSISSIPSVIMVLSDLIEAPLRGFLNFRSQESKERELRAQRESIALVQRMIRSSSGAVDILRLDARLRKVLLAVIAQGELSESTVSPITTKIVLDPTKSVIKKKKGTATIVDLVGLKPHEMARVAAWGLGGVPWKPKVPGQKGLRILSFDGGGTRGVFSIAMLKELMLRVGKSSPFESFDIICGTSTGGIIAMLLGVKRTRVDEAEQLYDDLIDRIFGSKSNLKLVTEQAFYDENDFEKILYDICGDELLIDSNRYDCARVFCISTRVNNNPPLIHLWRNYNYPPGLESRYSGEFRINTYSSVRATTAAPTFFTPVLHEGGLYCDGALVANNPTAIALQEAKVLYPNVPIELVVSIGTGYFNQNSNVQSLGWDLLVNQLIASSTDTEDVHALLVDFLPKDKYFRLNAQLQDLLAIDEKNKKTLLDLKRLAKQTWRDIDLGKDAKRFEQLIKTLKGNSK